MFERSHFRRVPAWVNMRRAKDLISFRSRAEEYFRNTKITWPTKDLVENKRAKELRESLNRDLVHIEWLVGLAGISDKVSVREAPMLGGRVFSNVPLLANMFNAHTFDQEPSAILDFLDRAIGTLEHDRRSALMRTFNPLFWMGHLLSAAARLPFFVLGELGFNRARAEQSAAGKLLKGLIWLIGILGSIATLVEFLGFGTSARTYLHSWGLLL